MEMRLTMTVMAGNVIEEQYFFLFERLTLKIQAALKKSRNKDTPNLI